MTIRGRTWGDLCSTHLSILNEYARGFPPAIETAEKAKVYLVAIADTEVHQPEAEMPRPACPACAIGHDRPEDSDYACLRAVRCALPPEQVPLDVVCEAVHELTGPEQAVIVWDEKKEKAAVSLRLFDHRENDIGVPIRIEAYRSGAARLGKHLRFTLTPIASGMMMGDAGHEVDLTVWKLRPSLNIPGLVRAFVTIIDELH
jgi:hypothetical protein